MNMKKLCVLLLVSLFLSVGAADKKPNFVFFLVDDMGWGDLGCYGSKLHETPHIDKISTEGMKFTQGYSACTVCSPSRAAILTGRYPGRLHLTDWIAGHRRSNAKLKIPDWQMYMDHDRTTLPEALKEADYNTAFVGKWHIMPNNDKSNIAKHFPTSHGFDKNYGGREWGQPKGPGKYFYPFGMPNVEGEKGDYLTDVLTDNAVDFVNKQTEEKPFLLYFSYYVVHGPIMAKKEYVDKYKAKLAAGKYIQKNPTYAGMMQSLDDSVGRVLEAVKKKGFEDNTIVIFTADNGGVSQTSSGGLRGAKALSYEGGTREAFLIKWPGVVKAGSVCNEPVIGTDFYPTMLEMAGLPLKKDEHKDGLSLLPLLKQSGSLSRDNLYWHYPHYHKTKPYGAIRHKDYKLIEFFEDGKLELYDLKKDMAESKDLSQKMPEKTQELYAMMKKWRSDVGAQMPTTNPDYDLNKPAGKKKKKKKRKKK
jgi:arylsulfatase A